MSSRRPRAAHLTSDRGQTIFLLPTAFLILLTMATIVLEAAALHLAQRNLDDLADSLANDVVAFGFDETAYRQEGEIRVDRVRALSVTAPAISVSNVPDATVRSLRVDETAQRVEVVLTSDHDPIIAGFLSSAFGSDVSATGRAQLVASNQ